MAENEFEFLIPTAFISQVLELQVYVTVLFLLYKCVLWA